MTIEIDDIISTELEIFVFPNPASNSITVQGWLSIHEEVTFEIFSLTGKQLFSQIKSYDAGKFQLSLNLNTLAAGIYLLQIKTASKFTTKKIIKHE